MKRILISLILIIATGLACLWVGYHLRSKTSLSDEKETYLLHEGFNRQAKVSLETLQALDAGTADIAILRRNLTAHLFVYCKEVEDLRKQYDWQLLNDDLYDKAKKYLEEHPIQSK